MLLFLIIIFIIIWFFINVTNIETEKRQGKILIKYPKIDEPWEPRSSFLSKSFKRPLSKATTISFCWIEKKISLNSN